MWRFLFFVFPCCVLLQACAEKFYEQRPFDVSKADQVFSTRFIVKDKYDYRIALIFDWQDPNNLELSAIQEKIVGTFRGKGVPLPLHLKIYRNGQVFADRVIQTDSLDGYKSFCYNKNTSKNDPFPNFLEDLFSSEKCQEKPGRKDVRGPIRTVDVRPLPPGKYLIELKTIIPIAEFSNMDTYVEIAPYSPKI